MQRDIIEAYEEEFEIEQKMLKARTALVLDQPFFGHLALKFNLVEDRRVKTAGIDAENIRYNPDYIDSLTFQETVGVMAHEILHAALGHCWRCGSRELRKWNEAADYTINYNLLGAGFTLPEGAYFNKDYRDLSPEEVYALLPDSPEDKQSQKDKGEDGESIDDPGLCGVALPVKETSDTEQIQSEMKIAVKQALQVDQGKMPSDLRRMIEKSLESKIAWYVLLRDLIERSARNDYDWTRPSRRYLQTGVILPSLISEELPEIAIAIDTSGSITKEQLETFSSEASAVLASYDTTIRVIYCDAAIKGEQVFSRADLPFKLSPMGGGGTNFKPVFEYITEKLYSPKCLIYFTDLFGTFPDKEPDYPIMWLVPDTEINRTVQKVPFGDIVYF